MKRAAAGTSCWWGLLVLGALCPLLALRVDPHAYRGGRSRDIAARSVRNTSALASVLGELRTSISDMLYIKTERYLHGGVGYIPHHTAQLLSAGQMESEVAGHQAEVGDAAEHHAGHDHTGHDCPSCQVCPVGTPTLIPEAARDYRGFIGTLHRAVQPWRDPSRPHLHSDGTQLLPWFRIMTLNDPHYIMGYTVGGWWVSQHDPGAALAFVDEGIGHNPEAFQIRLTRGLLRLRLLRTAGAPPAGLLAEVTADLHEAVALGLLQRPDPALGPVEEQPGWSLFQEQDLWTACQTRVILEQRYGDKQVARRLAQEYLRIFPENPILRQAAGEELE